MSYFVKGFLPWKGTNENELFSVANKMKVKGLKNYLCDMDFDFLKIIKFIKTLDTRTKLDSSDYD